jgi:hypothetical protein
MGTPLRPKTPGRTIHDAGARQGPSLSRQLDDRPPRDDQYRRDRRIATEPRRRPLGPLAKAVAVGPAALVPDATRQPPPVSWVMIGVAPDGALRVDCAEVSDPSAQLRSRPAAGRMCPNRRPAGAASVPGSTRSTSPPSKPNTDWRRTCTPPSAAQFPGLQELKHRQAVDARHAQDEMREETARWRADQERRTPEHETRYGLAQHQDMHEALVRDAFG